MVEAWKVFLESLATRGGRIFVLSGFVGVLIVVGVFFAYYPPAHREASEALLALVDLAAGALLTSLRGNPPPKPSEGKQ
ncbi:hypothetical protein LCGC14_1530910 [marine sediment metagenome]|uniref:Uncharacterized protein n=1 Tax=marine sediment metagenome TaxID=412755 RepID=A0A0F9JGR6_9ZZZZ